MIVGFQLPDGTLFTEEMTEEEYQRLLQGQGVRLTTDPARILSAMQYLGWVAREASALS